MSVANSQHHTSNGVESFHTALRRRVRVTHSKLFIFLKHVGQVRQDTVVDWDRLTRGCQIYDHRRSQDVSGGGALYSGLKS